MAVNKKSKSFDNFKDFFENAGIEFEKTVETVSRQDENMANNRLFVWNFEAEDLEEMVGIFGIFKRDFSNEASRQKLNGNLLRKMNAMIREGYNPVECMLYASKTINQKLNNDKYVQDILAERIRDIYLKKEDETADILKNIIEMWTWVPQLKVVINAIGLIGENEELLDLVSLNYGEDETLKGRAFHAFMQNKSLNNLERALKIVTNLQNAENDQIMGRRFAAEVGGFGWEGIQLVGKYKDHPAVTKTGKAVIRRALRTNGTVVDEADSDSMYRETLATKSQKDDLAFQDFMEDCRENYDRKSAFLCRFSRAEAGQFLKEMLTNADGLEHGTRTDAIISLAILGKKGYTPAASVLQSCYEKEDADKTALVVAQLMLGNREAMRQVVDLFCTKREYELSQLYHVLKLSNFTNIRSCSAELGELQRLLCDRFTTLVDDEDFYALEILSSNLQILWDKKLYYLISLELFRYMQIALKGYANGEYGNLPEPIVTAMINTIVYNWNHEVEDVIFQLFHKSSNARVQQLSYKILQGREVQAPK